MTSGSGEPDRQSEGAIGDTSRSLDEPDRIESLEHLRIAIPWRESLPLLAASGGVLIITVYVMGWLRWAGYLNYYGLPVSSAELNGQDLARMSIYGFSPLIAAIVVAPFLIAGINASIEARKRTPAVKAELDTLRGEAESAMQGVKELVLKVQRARTDAARQKWRDRLADHLEELEEPLREQKARLKSLQRLGPAPAWAMVAVEMVAERPRWMLWLALAVFSTAGEGVLYYASIRSASALWELPVRLVTNLLAFGGVLLILEGVGKRRLTGAATLLIIMLMLGLPATAFLNGYMSGYAQWHAKDRPARFERVVLHTKDRLDEGPASAGGIYSTGVVHLLARTGGSFLILHDLNKRQVSVIDADAVVQADFLP